MSHEHYVLDCDVAWEPNINPLPVLSPTPLPVPARKLDPNNLKAMESLISVPYLDAGVIVHLRFQQLIAKSPQFADEEYLLECQAQYIKFMALQAKIAAKRAKLGKKAPVEPPVVPTNAVDVFWQAHLIRPLRYQKWCKEQFACEIDRDLCLTDPVLGVAGSQKVWEEEYKEKYEEPKWAGKLKQLSSEDKKTDSAPAVSCAKPGTEVKKAVLVKTKGKAAPESSEFMITVADVIKDREWYGHLKSFTNLDDKELMEQKFLQRASQKYRCFLQLCASYPKKAKQAVPVSPIDLFWHTHQMFPLTYARDCNKAKYGFLLDHNPWPNCAKDGSREEASAKIWLEHFGEEQW